MGYQTVLKVPRIRSYDVAHTWWERTKPIRGRSEDLRPLADRRYADCYSIRKNADNNAIECVLYKTPVVAFMPDGEIHITNGGWATASTHMFIEGVLGNGISVGGQRGKTIVRVDDSVLSLGDDDGEVLRLRILDGRLKAITTQTHYAYRVNRKGANTVRGRFKDFYDYFKGFVKLRAEESQGGHYGPMRTMINCAFTELADALGEKAYYDTSYSIVNKDKWDSLTKKPNTYSGWRKASKEDYETATTEFLALIASDQPEETKHENFHKAALVLLTYNHTSLVEKRADRGTRTIWFDVAPAKNTLDTVLFKWFSNEVFERYEVPKDKVPNMKYNSWVDGEST